MIRRKRLPGISTTPAPIDDLGGEQAQEQRRLPEGLGHRPFHSDRLGHRVGGRQGHHGRGQRRGAQQADAEQGLGASCPANGSSALAASAAELSGPVPPMTAAVAMMMHIETRSDTMAPLTASTRSYLYSSGPMPRSTTAPAVYSWM